VIVGRCLACEADSVGTIECSLPVTTGRGPTALPEVIPQWIYDSRPACQT